MFKSISIFSGSANRPLAESIASYLELPMGRAELTRFLGWRDLRAHRRERARRRRLRRAADLHAGQRPLDGAAVMVDRAQAALRPVDPAVLPTSATRAKTARSRRARRSPPSSPPTCSPPRRGPRRLGRPTRRSDPGLLRAAFRSPYANSCVSSITCGRSLPRSRRCSSRPMRAVFERTRAYAKRLNADLAIIDKRRGEGERQRGHDIIGNVSGRDCIIVDDMIDTAGTLCNAADALVEAARAAFSRPRHTPCSRARGQAHRRIEARRSRNHRHDPAQPGRHRHRPLQGADRRALARRGHQAHPSQRLRQLAVRHLISSHPHNADRH